MKTFFSNMIHPKCLLPAAGILFAVTISGVLGENAANTPAEKAEFRNIQVFTLENPVIGVPILPHDKLVPANIPGIAMTNELRITAAKGEYESAGIVIHALKDVHGLLVEAGDFIKEGGGQIIPSDEIDVRAVKCWFQADQAWHGIGINPSNSTAKLVPELLLKNDRLVRVDKAGTNNYLRLQFPEGEKEIWISNPAKTNSDVILRPGEFPVRDSKKLLPLDLPAGLNKQYWLTIRVPRDAAEGNYTSLITIKNRDGELDRVLLRLRVLPFSLPSPRTWYDNKNVFISSLYYTGKLSDDWPDGSISSVYKSETQLRAELRDMLAHNVFNPLCAQDFPGLGTYLKIRNEQGMRGRPLFWIGQEPMDKVRDDAGLQWLRKMAQRLRETAATYGIKEVYLYGIDEAENEKLLNQQKAWETAHQAGAKIFVAGYTGSYEKVGSVLDLQVQAHEPLLEEARKWHSAGHKICSYFNPQAGPENPEIFRRNYGLLLWKAEYDGAMTFAYQCGNGNIYNDFDHKQYRDLVFSYPTLDGVIPTLAIEGYREGIDDIRYATLLRSLIVKNQGWWQAKNKLAESAGKYLETLDVNGNLAEIRQEMIKYILKLME